MAGMQSQVHLVADRPGTYDGVSANFSGDGFSDMKFTAKAVSAAQFEGWVNRVRHSSEALDAQRYTELAKPSDKNSVEYFASVDPLLYVGIVEKYMGVDDGMRVTQNLCAPAAIVAQRSE
jgi:cytochrome o ubiquinol oxidase subunit 2